MALANTILTTTRNFLTTASNLPWQHDTTLSVLPLKCSPTSCRASGFQLSRQTLNRSLKALRTASPFSEPKIAWEYAFWNFQEPKIPKCALPLPPRLSETQTAWKGPKYQNVYSRLPPPLRDPDCLGVRILELSRAQNTKMCTPASKRPRLPGSTHFGTFNGPKY